MQTIVKYSKSDVRLKQDREDQAGPLVAVLSSSRRDLVGDRILPEALDAWVEGWDGKKVPMLRDHNRGQVVGEWTSFETSKAEDGETELTGTGKFIPELSLAPETEILVEREIIRSTSIGFYFDDIRFVKEGIDIGEVDIREASLVLFPANPDAEIQSHALYHEDGTVRAGAVRSALERTGLTSTDVECIVATIDKNSDPVYSLMREVLRT